MSDLWLGVALGLVVSAIVVVCWHLPIDRTSVHCPEGYSLEYTPERMECVPADPQGAPVLPWVDVP